jgi:hypothetical protein
MTRRWSRYTAAELRRALRLRDGGARWQDIGRTLERSPWGLYQRLRDDGLVEPVKRRVWSDSLAPRLRYLLSAGASDEQIARRFGVCSGTVSHWRRRRLGVRRRAYKFRVDWTPERVAALTDMIAAVLSRREVAQSLMGDWRYRSAVLGKAWRLAQARDTSALEAA